MVNEDIQYQEEQPTLDLADYLAILRRRRLYLVLPAVVILVLSVAAAFLWPATYRSTATILIEQQQIPQDLVRSTVTSYAGERIQIISQRVMTTANLSQIIEKYDLYVEAREKYPMSTIVDSMRRKIDLDMISADVVDPRSGSAKQATIAFTLSFDSSSGSQAQKVTNELVSLFLNENIRNRREAAEETASFLVAEADRLEESIAGIEAKVARFKQEYSDNLPDMQVVNAQLMSRIEESLERNSLEARLLDERIFLLEAELARTSRYGDDDVDMDSRVLTPRERLVQLELEYAELAARTKPKHPDRRLLEREMRELREQTGGLKADDFEALLEKARLALADLRKELPETHPEVKGAIDTVASLEEKLATARARGDQATGSRLPENPAYLRLKEQLRAARSEHEFLRDKKIELSSELELYEQRLKAAPKIDHQYKVLTRDYENDVAKYREIKAKQMEAELGESLEAERMAERLAIIEPPIVPNEPIKPNRLAILFLGLVFSIGGGVGTAVLRETVDAGMYGSKAIAAVTGAPPIAVIPVIETEQEHAAKRRRKLIVVAVVILLFAGTLAAIHTYYRPLDIIAYQVMQRIDRIQSSAGN